MKANELFKSMNYQDALVLYRDVKIGAIQLGKYVRKKRVCKALKDAEKVTLPEYLKTEKDGCLISKEDLKLSPRPDPLER